MKRCALGVILGSKGFFLDYQYFTSSSEWLICSLQDLVVADPSSQSDIGDNVVEQHHKHNGFPKPRETADDSEDSV